MKRKLFLTSMLALMIACPAVGTSTVDINNCVGNETGACGAIEASDTSASCDATPLTWDGTANNYGTYTLTAQWQVDECPITLDSHNGVNGYGDTASNPTMLYARYGNAVYLTESDRADSINAMTTSGPGLTTNPTGKTYTLTLNPNLPGSHSVGEISNSTGYAASTTAQMSFQGFFSESQTAKGNTNGTKYISNVDNGKITASGITAGTTISKNSGTCPTTTWHAQYICNNATTYTPALTGYTFDGWYNQATGGSVETDFCLDSDKTVYAHWTADTCVVRYNPTSVSYPTSETYDDTATYDSPYSKPDSSTPVFSGIILPVSGYTFRGWSRDPNPTVTKNIDGSYIISNEWTWNDGTNWNVADTQCPFNVYAAFSANEYTVTYDCNGGNFVSAVNNGSFWTSGTIGSDKVTFKTTEYSARTPSNTCEKTGSNISNAWSCYKTEDESTSVSTSFATPWALPYDVTCKASYDVSSFTISYSCGTYGSSAQTVGGSAPSTTTHSYQGSWTLAATPDTCAQAGYHFAGWHCTVNPGTGLTDNQQSYYSFNATIPNTGSFANTYAVVDSNNNQVGGSKYNYAGNITCEAQWEANEVNLIWYKDSTDQANGIPYTTGNPTTSCQYGIGTISTLPTEPTKDGHTFVGWTVTYWSGSSQSTGN